MSTCRRETAPGTWDDAFDGAFFRLTAHVFAPQFCLGATVLLASYDDETPATPGPAAAPVTLQPRIVAQPVSDRAA